MVDSSKQHFGYESKAQRPSLGRSEQSVSTEDGSDEGSVDFSLPWRRRFIHSDVEYTSANRDSIASSSSGRPASTPGNFPDIHRLPPISVVDRSRLEEVEKNSDIKSRVDVWISRLDRLISDSSQTDQSLELSDLTPESFSSQDTLTSGSSSSTELPEEDEDIDAVEKGVVSSYLSLDEVLREAVCQSTFDSKDCLLPETELAKPFQQDTQQKEEQSSPKVTYGTVCSDIFQACKILNTRYKMEGIAVRKPVMTWSKWNVSQVVRGPHVKSPIWNPTLKRKWDRPDSIVFQELNREITRRNEELEEIVRKKTETLQHRSSAPATSFSSLSPPPLTSSIPPPPPSPMPLVTTSLPPSTGNPPSDPLNPRLSLPPRSQSKPVNPLSDEVSRQHFIMPVINPQATSRTDPGGYPHDALTIDDAEDEGPSSPSAGSTTASSPSSSSSSGMGLLRRMVKSVWNIFRGDGGCHRERSNSSK